MQHPLTRLDQALVRFCKALIWLARPLRRWAYRLLNKSLEKQTRSGVEMFRRGLKRLPDETKNQATWDHLNALVDGKMSMDLKHLGTLGVSKTMEQMWLPDARRVADPRRRTGRPLCNFVLLPWSNENTIRQSIGDLPVVQEKERFDAKGLSFPFTKQKTCLHVRLP
jgi:hypothetical protein